MTRITLTADSLVSTLPTLLPVAAPDLLSQQEAIAALLHTIHTTIGFELIAVDEVSTPIHATTNVLPVSWNARAPDFTLKYRHPESPTATLTIKILKLSNRMLIHGNKEQTEADASFEFSTATYVSPSYFPSSPDSEPLIHAFVSAERLEEFVTEYLNKIVKILTPDISLESPQPSESATQQTEEGCRREGQETRPINPLRPTLPSPSSTGLPHPGGLDRASQGPFEIGRQDLDPIPSPFAPAPLFGGIQPGGGMYVGPDHPMFAGRGGGGRRDQAGPWAGDGYLPPLGAPPGARFDPVGPFGRGGFPGVGRGRGGPPGAFGGDPDNDEFPPPGLGGPGAFGGNHKPFGGPGNMYM